METLRELPEPCTTELNSPRILELEPDFISWFTDWVEPPSLLGLQQIIVDQFGVCFDIFKLDAHFLSSLSLKSSPSVSWSNCLAASSTKSSMETQLATEDFLWLKDWGRQSGDTRIGCVDSVTVSV